MDMVIFPNCSPSANCDGSKASSKTEKLDGSMPFDKVLQDEEKKLSSEAQALMLALMQKTQTVLTTQMKQETPGAENLAQAGAAPVSLLGQELQVIMQQVEPALSGSELVDGVGTSQFVEETIQPMEVNSDNKLTNLETKYVPNFDAVTQLSEEMTEHEQTSPISFQALEAENADPEAVENNIIQRKTASEAAQRVDQVVKSVIQEEKPVSQQHDPVQKTVQPKEVTNDLVVEQNENNVDFSKVHIEQTVKSTSTNEPARLAEALPRQTLTQISDQIELMTQQGRNTLRIQLTPENLGKIDIRLVHNSQGVGVTVWTEQAETGRLLETQLNQLRDTLQNAGIQLSHFNIGQQNQGNRNGWLMENRGRSMTKNAINRIDEEPEQITQTVNVRKESGVDYRV